MSTIDFPNFALDAYQARAMRTHAPGPAQLACYALGVAGEAGEVADMVKKHLGHGHELDRDKLIKELGDVLWYVAGLAHLLDVPLSHVAFQNVLKLEKRYPNGFSHEASKARVDEQPSKRPAPVQVSPKLSRNKAKVAAPAPAVREPAPKSRVRVKPLRQGQVSA